MTFLKEPNKMEGKKMRKVILLMVFAFCFGAAGCSEHRAQELYDTAQLEERQAAFEHARQLYQDIVGKYPQTEVAIKARERLKALEGK
jgi:TolA-binding protein